MRLFKRHPAHLPKVYAIVFFQDAPDPRARCLRVGPNADAAPGKVGGGQVAAIRVVKDSMVLAARDLGYAPRYAFEEGMRITLEWYRNHRSNNRPNDR